MTQNTSTPPLAPQAPGGERACGVRGPRGRFVCAAVADHDGDHVPWGAAGTDEGLRKLTWPQDTADREAAAALARPLAADRFDVKRSGAQVTLVCLRCSRRVDSWPVAGLDTITAAAAAHQLAQHAGSAR